MLFRTLLLAVAATLHVSASPATAELTLDEIARRYTKRTPGGIHLPIVRQGTPATLERRGLASSVGLGDYFDVAYTVLLTVGGITTPLILDTGSSDLWVMSDACVQGCNGDAKVYPQASFQSSGLDITMLYGDSRTGTFATGLIGDDVVELAGLTLQNQYFAAINQTNTTVIEIGAAGIFGLGFPINSVVWNNLFVDKYHLQSTFLRRETEAANANTPFVHPNIKFGAPFPKISLRRYKFPSLPGILGEISSSSRHKARQTSGSVLQTVFDSWSTLGPLLPRFVNEAQLTQPMFTVTLQRNMIDVGGNVGMLSIGELPDDLKAEELTWTPLRGYNSGQGGIPAPLDSPAEVYPITWEIFLDDVYLDGEKLPRSSLSSSAIQLSALVDTGNSLIRGPADIVALIHTKLGNNGLFACSEPHTLTFEIGGKLFPVDPRDFATQAFENNVDACSTTLEATDPPRVGGYQFSWSLGAPFMKGVLSSYYFGNLSYPSQDAPRMGFLSTVPSNAGDLMKAAAGAASNNFPGVSQAAPTGSVKPAQTNSNGVPQATNVTPKSSGACSHSAFGPFLSLSSTTVLFALYGLITDWSIWHW